MSAAVSGVTAMSEALGGAGGVGTEQLRTIIDELFTSVVALVRDYGGEIASFAGDGATAVFPRPRADRSAGTARRALRCAFEVQRAVADLGPQVTLAGTFSLSVSVGLACGTIHTAVVGQPGRRVQYVAFGEAVVLCARAGHAAGPGEVVVAERLLAELERAGVRPEASPAAGASGHWRVDGGGSAPVRPRPLRSRAGVDDGMELARPYLPAPIFDRLRAGRFALVDEHRRVTALFCRFGDLAPGDPAAGRRLQRIATDADALATRFGGYLCRLQFGDSGSTMTVLFGAPTGHEDDERRAVACALELRALGSLRGAAIGIHTAVLFCGLVGSAERCEYSVVGDGANVAARLMGAAKPGQVVVSARTQRRAQGPWTWRRLAPLALEGRTGTLAVLEPRPRTRPVRIAPGRHATLVGRERELELLCRRLDALDQGEGGAAVLRGEAGIGKTRLLRALAQDAAMRGVAVCSGRGERESADAPYAAWRSVWRALLGASPRTLATLRRLLENVVPGLGPRAELLAPLVGLSGGHDATTAGLPPALRAEALQELAIAVLARRSASQRLLLVLDDVQWLDPASRELLDRVATAAGSAGFLVVAGWRSAGEQGALVQGAAALEVAALDRTAIAEIVRLRHRTLPAARRDVAADLLERIADKASGNPLYAEELVGVVHERESDALPESLRGAITARIDALGERERAVLEVASVVGRRFEPRRLAACHPELGSASEVSSACATLNRLRLTQPDAAEAEVFRHPLVQEVAYETLSFASRQMLHEAVARYVESTHDVATDRATELLAYHYGRSARTDKQRIWLRRAGDAARHAYAGGDAVRHYRRLLPLLRGEERADLLLDLGEVLEHTGAWADADAAYRAALERADAPPRVARARAALGALRAYRADHRDAAELLETARRELARLDARGELATVLGRLAFVYWQQGDFAVSERCCREHIELARELGDVAGEALAHDTLGLALGSLGDKHGARAAFTHALRLAERAGDEVTRVRTLNDFAILLEELDEREAAAECLHRAFALAREIGYRRGECFVAANAAGLHRAQGVADEALRCLAIALPIAAELDDVATLLSVVLSLALIESSELGGGEDALRALALATRVAARVDNRRFVAQGFLEQARICRGRGRTRDALRLAARAVGAARRVDDHRLSLDARALAVQLRGSGEEQRHALATLLEDCVDERDEASVLHALWTAAPAPAEARDAAASRYARLYERTGNADARRRYRELTGGDLRDAPALRRLTDDDGRCPTSSELLSRAVRALRRASAVVS